MNIQEKISADSIEVLRDHVDPETIQHWEKVLQEEAGAKVQQKAWMDSKEWAEATLQKAQEDLQAHRNGEHEKLLAFAENRDRRGLSTFRTRQRELESLVNDLERTLELLNQKIIRGNRGAFNHAHVARTQIRERLAEVEKGKGSTAE